MFLSGIKRSTALLGLVLLASLTQVSAYAQSAADNIRPVGQICMAGQPCVGTTGNASSSSAAPAEVAAEPVTTEPAPADPEPAATEVAAAESSFDAAAAYQASCFACHGSDALGAPQPGDAAAWEERIAKGMDAVMANVINGFNAMPARGICMTCSDDDLQAIVDYMLAQ